MRTLWTILLLIVIGGRTVQAQETAEPSVTPEQREQLYREFEQMMSGVALVGHFTVTGKDTPPKEERYEISRVKKLPQGDYWQFVARIAYGDKDVTLPLPLEVKWAATTPVITLSDLTIPGLGTFSARVLVHDGKYAGTWSHGEVGGHLYGLVERIETEERQ